MIAILIILAVYIFSIFLCRYSYRMQYVWGHWGKDDITFSLLWIIPFFNTLAAITFLCMGYTAKKRTYKYKLPNWFTNKDL